jgi:hypothetical protein
VDVYIHSIFTCTSNIVNTTYVQHLTKGQNIKRKKNILYGTYEGESEANVVVALMAMVGIIGVVALLVLMLFKILT